MHPKGSAGFTGLFPRGRRPLTNGSKESRIAAFVTLEEAMENYAPLAGVQALIKAYADDLVAKRAAQLQKKKTKSDGSDDVEKARLEMCDMMFKNTGDLMSLYYKERNRIANFFPLELLRNFRQADFHRLVKPQKTVFIVKHTLEATQQLTFDSLGDKRLGFWLTANKWAPRPADDEIFWVDGKDSKTVLASLMGAPEKMYLMVYNPEDVIGKCEIHLF